MNDTDNESTASTAGTNKSVSETELHARNSEIETLEKLLRSGNLSPDRLRDALYRLFELKGIHIDKDNDE